MEEEFFDVFLSYNSQDKDLVEEIAGRLEDEAGLRPFLDEWHLIPGTLWQEAIERALSHSKTVAVFVGPKGLGPWENMELRASFDKLVRDKKLRVIPVWLPGADPKKPESLPWFLANVTWVDLSQGLNHKDAFSRLVSGIRGVAPGRRSPSVLPTSSLYVQKSIRQIMAARLKKDSLDISSVLPSREFTLQSLAKRCQLLYPQITVSEMRRRLGEARSVAFEEKYSSIGTVDDERYLDFIGWESEFRSLLFQLGLNALDRIRAINVGIGNGNECPGFYNEFQSFFGVDISKRSLETAQKKFASMKTVQSEAEDLSDFGANVADLYISLRTYQSTFLDIDEALFEAYRVLRPGGHCVISIPYLYYVEKKLMRGLQRPGTKELDIDLPYVLTDRIRRGLNALDFRGVRINSGRFEIYTYGEKAR